MTKTPPPSPITGERRHTFDECEVGDFLFESEARAARNTREETGFEWGPWRSNGYRTERTVVRVS